MRLSVALAICLASAPAAADLYRWVDPATGTVKFSSYPPPWYGDEAREKRAPKVEVIPARRDAASQPAFAPDEAPVPAAPGAADGRLAALEAQRRGLLQQLQAAGAGGPKALEKPAEALAAVSDQLDKLDPLGAQRRRAETDALIQGLLKGPAR
jgi:hypothetical protein